MESTAPSRTGAVSAEVFVGTAGRSPAAALPCPQRQRPKATKSENRVTPPSRAVRERMRIVKLIDLYIDEECSDSTQLTPIPQQAKVTNQMRISPVSPLCPPVVKGFSNNFTRAPHSAITRTDSRSPESTSPDDPNPTDPLLRTPGRNLLLRLLHPPRVNRP